MTGPTHPDGQAAVDADASAGERDFVTVMLEYIKSIDRKRKFMLWPPLVIMLTIGAALGAVIPSWTAITVAALLVLVMPVAFLHADPVAGWKVDWDTADPYKKQITQDLHPDVLAVLQETEATVNANLGAPQTHLMQVRFLTQGHDGRPCEPGCTCDLIRLMGAGLVSRTHPILIVGERLLTDPGLLQMVLGHEARHTSRPLRYSRVLWQTAMSYGWLALGLTVPLHWLPYAAPVLLGVVIAWIWGEEIACDIASARHPRADARGWYTAYLTAHRSTPLRTRARWLLAPIHPPMPLRAAIVNRFVHRPNNV